MIKTHRKKTVPILASLGISIFIIITTLITVDEKIIWGLFPGVTSTKDTQEMCCGLVAVMEELDKGQLNSTGENTVKAAAGFVMAGAVAKAAETAHEGAEADSILSQYTIVVLKCKLLEYFGNLSPAEYQLIKIPYKTGNTGMMEAMLPYAQKKAQLPEGFMSKEE